MSVQMGLKGFGVCLGEVSRYGSELLREVVGLEEGRGWGGACAEESGGEVDEDRSARERWIRIDAMKGLGR